MNKNVIFTVDAAAIPPVYNQDDAARQRLTVGAWAHHGWEVLQLGYLDTLLTQSVDNGNA